MLRTFLCSARCAVSSSSPAQVGLAWLLAHAPNTLLIAGTRSIDHLEQNIGAADIELSPAEIARLDSVSTPDADPPIHGVEGFIEQR